MGAERKSAVITPETAKCTAYHEAGHALVGVFLMYNTLNNSPPLPLLTQFVFLNVGVLTEGSRPIHKATIVPRGNSLGMVTSLPEGDQTSMSWKQMIGEIFFRKIMTSCLCLSWANMLC
jgi:ATP-dependent metalloprotease